MYILYIFSRLREQDASQNQFRNERIGNFRLKSLNFVTKNYYTLGYIIKTSNNKIKQLMAREIKTTYGHFILRNKKLDFNGKFTSFFLSVARNLIFIIIFLFYQMLNNCPIS